MSLVMRNSPAGMEFVNSVTGAVVYVVQPDGTTWSAKSGTPAPTGAVATPAPAPVAAAPVAKPVAAPAAPATPPAHAEAAAQHAAQHAHVAPGVDPRTGRPLAFPVSPAPAVAVAPVVPAASTAPAPAAPVAPVAPAKAAPVTVNAPAVTVPTPPVAASSGLPVITPPTDVPSLIAAVNGVISVLQANGVVH